MILLDNTIFFIIIIILIALSIVSIVFATISYGKYDDLKTICIV